MHVGPDGVVRDPGVGGKESEAVITLSRVLLPKAPVSEETGAPALATRVRGIIRNGPEPRQNRLNGLVGFVRNFAGHEFPLERQRQVGPGHAGAEWVVEAVAHSVEVAVDAGCLRTWEGQAIGGASGPVRVTTEPFRFLLREPGLP